MDGDTLAEELGKKKDAGEYVRMMTEDTTGIPLLLDVIETDATSVKYLCEKIVRALSGDAPELLYPYFDRMFSLLDSDNSFIRWGFILTMPNLLAVDTEEKGGRLRAKWLELLESESIAAFGNAVQGLPKLLAAFPGFDAEFVPVLLQINEHVFLHKGEPSPECLNVAKGHILALFDVLCDDSQFKTGMVGFAHSCIDNTRSQVRADAKRFLKKHGA